jgi:hypothetical protein
LKQDTGEGYAFNCMMQLCRNLNRQGSDLRRLLIDQWPQSITSCLLWDEFCAQDAQDAS